MAFWTQPFMDRMRNEWLRRLVKFQYKANNVWYDTVITDKRIVGNTLRITTVTTDSAALTITSVRVIDISGEVVGERSENIVKSATQGVLTLWEFPLYELVEG